MCCSSSSIAQSWDRYYEATGWWGVALVTALCVLPFAAGTWLSRHCTAWNATVAGRCAKNRPWPFQRCEVTAHGRAHQLVTAPEVGATVCFLLGAGGVWALFAL